jgi:hypothetical protein
MINPMTNLLLADQNQQIWQKTVLGQAKTLPVHEFFRKLVEEYYNLVKIMCNFCEGHPENPSPFCPDMR